MNRSQSSAVFFMVTGMVLLLGLPLIGWLNRFFELGVPDGLGLLYAFTLPSGFALLLIGLIIGAFGKKG